MSDVKHLKPLIQKWSDGEEKKKQTKKTKLPACCFIASCISPFVSTINNDQFSDSLNMDHWREGGNYSNQVHRNKLSNSSSKGTLVGKKVAEHSVCKSAADTISATFMKNNTRVGYGTLVWSFRVEILTGVSFYSNSLIQVFLVVA